jgi:hypothetical protein
MKNKNVKIFCTILLSLFTTSFIISPIGNSITKEINGETIVKSEDQVTQMKMSNFLFNPSSHIKQLTSTIKNIERTVNDVLRIGSDYAMAIKWISDFAKWSNETVVTKNIPITYFDNSKMQFVTSQHIILVNKDGSEFTGNLFAFEAFRASTESRDSIIGYKVKYSDNTSHWEYSGEKIALKRSNTIKSITAIQKGFTVNDAYRNISKKPIILKINNTDTNLPATHTIKPGESLFIHSVGKQMNREISALVNIARLDNMPLKNIPSQRIIVNLQKEDLDSFQQQYSSEYAYNYELDLSDSWVVTNGSIVFNDRYRLFKGIYFKNSKVVSTVGDIGLTHSGAPTDILGYTIINNNMYFKTIIPVPDVNERTPYTKAYFEVPLSVYETKNKTFDVVYNTKDHLESIARSDSLDNINRITGYFPKNYSDTNVITDHYFRYNLVNESTLPLPEMYFTGLAVALRYINNLFKYIEIRNDNKFVILNQIPHGTKEHEFANKHLSEFYLSSERVNSIREEKKTIKDGYFNFSDRNGLFVSGNGMNSTHFGKRVKTWNRISLVVPRNDLWFRLNMNTNSNNLLSYNDYLHGLIHEMGHIVGLDHTNPIGKEELLSPKGLIKSYYSRGSVMGARVREQLYTSLSDVDYGYTLGTIKITRDIIKKANEESKKVFTTWFGFTEQDVQALWLLYSPSSNLQRSEV